MNRRKTSRQPRAATGQATDATGSHSTSATVTPKRNSSVRQRDLILRYLRECKRPAGPKEIAEGCGLPEPSVRRILQTLVKEGICERLHRGEYVLRTREATDVGKEHGKDSTMPKVDRISTHKPNPRLLRNHSCDKSMIVARSWR